MYRANDFKNEAKAIKMRINEYSSNFVFDYLVDFVEKSKFINDPSVIQKNFIQCF